jgi:hypothetical protein
MRPARFGAGKGPDSETGRAIAVDALLLRGGRIA